MTDRSPSLPGRRRVLAGLVIGVALSVTLTGQPVGAEVWSTTHQQAGAPAHPKRPVIVTLGDSFISGEAGRWAGSSDISTAYADALGPTAYFDNKAHTKERIPGCHRSASAEAYIGHGVHGVNLACSGADTSTQPADGGDFKPGLDFYDDGRGDIGQALALERLASRRDVRMVVVSIGGNDFGFAGIVEQCVLDFLTSPTSDKKLCRDDPVIDALFSQRNVTRIQRHIARALDRVRHAMRDAGYRDSSWTLVVQNYPSVLPRGRGFRYSQAGLTRQFVGGCGFWNADADWADSVVVPTINATVAGAIAQSGISGVRQLDISHAFNGRRLCEKGVGLYEEEGLTSWTDRGAVNQTEWINQIRTASAIDSPYEVQESLHPNYWAQLALRNCLRQVYDAGSPVSGRCVISGSGLRHGEPRMSLNPSSG